MFSTLKFSNEIHPTSLAVLPGDLLLDIASCLSSSSDLLHFSQTSSFIFTIVVSALYANVSLSCTEQCISTLEMLLRRPDIARHTRNLAVRPTGDLARVSYAVQKLAVHLDALTAFNWDADEPHNDDMWFALRMQCPKLRHISTTIGSHFSRSQSHLFNFTNLLGLSLTLTPKFYKSQDGTSENSHALICDEFWAILTARSPNLEELDISTTPGPVHIHPLASARWKKLRRLSIGDVAVCKDARLESPTDKHPFITFLEAHPNLETIHLSPNTIHPVQLATINPQSLPRLTDFGGTLDQLRNVPHIHSQLKSLNILNPISTRDNAPDVLSSLRSLTVLTHLQITFALHMADLNGSCLLHPLIAGCPHLQSLHLACIDNPSFNLDFVSKAIRGFTKLSHLSLALVRGPDDDELSQGAIRIARANPRLQTFTLKYLPSKCYLVPFLCIQPPSEETGSYTLLCDEHGLPSTLTVHETRRTIWSRSFGAWRSSRRYSIDLGPFKHVSLAKRGVLRLLLEKSAAGDDVRVIVCSFVLFLLAMWGLATRKLLAF